MARYLGNARYQPGQAVSEHFFILDSTRYSKRKFELPVGTSFLTGQ